MFDLDPRRLRFIDHDNSEHSSCFQKYALISAAVVDEAGRLAAQELKEQGIRGGHGKKRRRDEGGGKDDMDRDDDVVEAGMPSMKK